MLSTHLLTGRKAFNLVLLVFQSSIVGLSISVPTNLGDVLAEAAHLVAVVGLVILSPREHYRSVSPSKSLVVYLSTRTFLNVSALLLGYDRGFTTIQALRIIIEAGNLIVEAQKKKHFLLEPFLDIAPEEIAGPWSKASFAWVNSILFAGEDIKLSLETLPQNPRRFDPSDLRRNILLAWDQRGKPISCTQRINLTNFYS
jgi:ATP-binding cassette subfamily C (CFTR/MRP) protein 1